MTTIRTRFAPSPTGALHIGGARTALFSWALAKHFGGTFVLRIEDTDVERSTPENVAEILNAMQWLSLTHDDGPYYQMQRMDRYREVIAQMLEDGTAYYCYTSKEELEAMREAQKARGEREKYDGTWRPEAGKTLPAIPAEVQPVVRFKNPLTGRTSWVDVVKGEISFNNEELDDLIIARPDGTPTYNFCVVVDDWDMGITHVIRGDDHVNNTPKQINILKALGAPIPAYGHIPMILAPDGTKLSKRKNATAVMDYERMGYLPEALNNYLARLGWGHGDDEIFTREQFVEWFSVEHLSSSSSQWDPKKLNWVNNHYINQKDNAELTSLIEPRVSKRLAAYEHVAPLTSRPLAAIVELYKSRSDTLEDIATAAEGFYLKYEPNVELIREHLNDANRPALADFATKLKDIAWEKESINALIKSTLADHTLKMSALGVPLRAILLGLTQSPSLDAIIHIIGRDEVVQRLTAGLSV
ncbi:glutamate--tRNA ligase [Formosimonas limnophila]|uniref:Glutamate--tRNA ligase n=1 Tax=Formosimonas limnophila TaxID=1384487 RepID=A0A8J3CM65_9BURK|nr:glutamate--tRNA ligase [Formosimonas limnophila]GHA65281.1 glutamate--tRNA ligase [Formosimonas limnophila]